MTETGISECMNEVQAIRRGAKTVLNRAQTIQKEETVSRLKGMRMLKKEVDDLSQRIAQIECDLAGEGKRISGLPFAGLYGRNPEEVRKEREILVKLEQRRAESMTELGELYDFIDGIQDPQLRLIFTHRYIDRLSWQAIAFKIDEYDEQVPRRLHDRFLKQMEAAFSKRKPGTD